MDSLAAFESALEAIPERIAVKAGDGPRLLSVTECLPFTGDRYSQEIAAACERGTAVHQITERHDRGEDVAVPPEYAGYFHGWRTFLKDTGAAMLEIEMRIGGEDLGYVGTLDRVATISRRLWILDIKTGRPWPTHGPQTAAYEHGYRALRGIKPAKKIRRACVHLSSTGSYSVQEHTDHSDYSVFLAYKRIAHFEISRGLRELPTGRY